MAYVPRDVGIKAYVHVSDAECAKSMMRHIIEDTIRANYKIQPTIEEKVVEEKGSYCTVFIGFKDWKNLVLDELLGRLDKSNELVNAGLIKSSQNYTIMCGSDEYHSSGIFSNARKALSDFRETVKETVKTKKRIDGRKLFDTINALHERNIELSNVGT
jgi:hypothetical protein